MIGRAKRFLQTRGAVPADFEQSIGELGSTLVSVLHPFEPFPDRFRDRFGHALSRNPSQLLGEFMRFFVLDVQTHYGRHSTTLLYISTINHPLNLEPPRIEQRPVETRAISQNGA